jgi:putative hydrolase of the HAD superfamily
MIRAILFDTDGVLALPEKSFSRHYAELKGLDYAPFIDFFKSKFGDSKLGKADLKKLILENDDVWHLEGSVEELLNQWFEYENVVNEPLVEIIQDIRKSGVLCFIATSQERNRADYIRDVMFKDKLDGFIFSCDLGLDKGDPEFFKETLTVLSMSPDDVAFIDDSQGNVDSAKSVGINAFLYTDISKVKEDLGL